MVFMLTRIVPEAKGCRILTLLIPIIGKICYLKIFEYKVNYLERREQLYHMVRHMGDLLDVSTQHRGLREIFGQCNSRTGKGKDMSEHTWTEGDKSYYCGWTAFRI